MSKIFSGPKPGDRPDAARYLPEKGPGRPKGTVDRITRAAKENIIAVFEDLGGIPAMTNWARRNKTEFYKLYARLIPVQVRARVDVRDASQFTDSELARIIAGESSEGIAGEEASESVSNGFH